MTLQPRGEGIGQGSILVVGELTGCVGHVIRFSHCFIGVVDKIIIYQFAGNNLFWFWITRAVEVKSRQHLFPGAYVVFC